ncbi:MAG: hypothetical protein MZV65_48720 [Chromatiales bacterium]|nr:hypothetical protein [Chromatiales bacterium]
MQNQDAYMQAVAGAAAVLLRRTSTTLAERCMGEYAALTGRRYGRVGSYQLEDADYLIVGMGSMIVQAEAVADYLRETRKLKVGVVNVTMFRPFPGDLLGADRCSGAQGRRRAGAHRPAAGRGPAADARGARHAWPSALENGAAQAATDAAATRTTRRLRPAATCRACTPAATAWARATCSPRR